MTNPTNQIEIIMSVQRRRRWAASEKVRMVDETQPCRKWLFRRVSEGGRVRTYPFTYPKCAQKKSANPRSGTGRAGWSIIEDRGRELESSRSWTRRTTLIWRPAASRRSRTTSSCGSSTVVVRVRELRSVPTWERIALEIAPALLVKATPPAHHGLPVSAGWPPDADGSRHDGAS